MKEAHTQTPVAEPAKARTYDSRGVEFCRKCRGFFSSQCDACHGTGWHIPRDSQ